MVAVLREVNGGFMVPAKVARHKRGYNGGRVRVCIIHGLNISHKELTYLLQKSKSYQNKVLRAFS